MINGLGNFSSNVLAPFHICVGNWNSERSEDAEGGMKVNEICLNLIAYSPMQGTFFFLSQIDFSAIEKKVCEISTPKFFYSIEMCLDYVWIFS